MARARQRAAVTASPIDVAQSESDVAPQVATPGLTWAAVGLLGIGAGGYALWHGATMEDVDDADPDELRRIRMRWVTAGALLVVVGIVALASVSTG